MTPATKHETVRELMRWYLDAGVDESICDVAMDRFDTTQPAMLSILPAKSAPTAATRSSASAPPSSPASAPPKAQHAQAPDALPIGTEEAIRDAVGVAAAANTVEELRTALESFEGCALKKTASNLVFADGDPQARVLLIGESPGADEDREGRPFVGPGGQLLDRMLASIGLERAQVLIANTMHWRPPGNRTPTTAELAICMPFVERLIEIVDPKILVVLGGSSAKILLAQSQGIGRLRGRWFDYASPRLSAPIAATPIFHPDYLLSSPGAKRDAWHDLLMIKQKLAG